MLGLYERRGAVSRATTNERYNNMAQLHITELKCIRKEDLFGKDEVVITADGQFGWSGKIGKGETIDGSLNYRRAFVDSVLVELKEANGGEMDGKRLGSWTIQAHPSGQRDPLTATSSGYHYEVYYHVD